jgi:hypothetical protein
MTDGKSKKSDHLPTEIDGTLGTYASAKSILGWADESPIKKKESPHQIPRG